MALEWANKHMEDVCLYIISKHDTCTDHVLQNMYGMVIYLLNSQAGPELLNEPFVREILLYMMETDDLEIVLFTFHWVLSSIVHVDNVAHAYITNLKRCYKELQNPPFGLLDPTLFYYTHVELPRCS